MRKDSAQAFVIAVALSVSWAAPPVARAADADQPGNADNLTEIVVTARRYEERLQDVPISIAVFDQKQITDRNITYAADLGNYMTSLTSQNGFGNDSSSFAIRGFSQAVATPPTVAVYFADAVAPRGTAIGESSGEGAGPGAFFDLQNVQVLSGPQGTLFGLNTTGGAVLLVPQKPTAETGGYVEASYGNFDMKRIQAVFNAPLTDNIRMRVGVDRQERDGYLRNISGIGPLNFNNIDYTAGRFSLVADLSANLENYTIATYSKSDNNGPMGQVFACDPTQPLAQLFACPQLARLQAANAGPYAVQNDLANARSYLRQWQVINTTTWRVSDDLTVKNIASYGQLKTLLAYDIYSTDWLIPPFIPGFGGQTLTFTDTNPPPGGSITDQSTMTEELQFQGHLLDSRLTWQSGVYFEYSRPEGVTGSLSPSLISCTNVTQFKCTDVLALAFGAPQGTVGGLGERLATGTLQDIAGYGQATYAFNDQFKVTGGVRYTSDKNAATATQTVNSFPAPNTPVPSCTSTLTNLALGCLERFDEKSQAPTWLIDFDYTPTKNVLLYIKESRGYRQGGVDTFGAEGYTTFGPEKVDAYEIGAKTSFEGEMPGTFNVAGFYNNFRDQQLLVGFLGKPGVADSSGIVNAGKSRIWGFEVGSSIQPLRSVTVSAAYTYLNTVVLQEAPVVLNPGAAYFAALNLTEPGSPLPDSPPHKATLTADYTLPLPSTIGKVTVGTTYVYTDAQFLDSATPFGHLPSTHLVNMNLNWTSVAGSPIDASLFVTNLTNKLYYNNVSTLYNSVGFEARTPTEPRMYGLRLRYRFGGP